MNPDEDADDVDIPSPPAPPPRAEIKIVDASIRRRGRACVVCGRAKPAYIEVEIDGVVEYTCRDCYELQAQGLSGEVTQFCTKCGTPAALKCPKCGARPDEEDGFCGKCGAALRPSP